MESINGISHMNRLWGRTGDWMGSKYIVLEGVILRLHCGECLVCALLLHLHWTA